MSIEAMKQALEAFEAIPEEIEGYLPEKCTGAVIALRHAIEQAEQKQPVAVQAMIDWYNSGSEDWEEFSSLLNMLTAQSPRKLWVGLTGDEVNEFAAGCHLGNSVQGAIRKAEAKIKEKNT